jgi:hypothetical protein
VGALTSTPRRLERRIEPAELERLVARFEEMVKYVVDVAPAPPRGLEGAPFVTGVSRF